MVFNFTHGCNLRCRYCFVRNYNPDKTGQIMPLDIARRALAMVTNAKPGGRVRIGFFGGEPLLAFDRMREIVAEAERVASQRGLALSMGVTTNGTLITPEVADYLALHKFSAIVSMDGPPEVHNARRPMPGGDSHAATMRGLELLRERGGAGIRGVTIRGTFDGRGADLAAELEYLNQLCDDGYAQHVSHEPVSLSESECLCLADGNAEAITLHNVRQFLPQYEAAALWMRDRLRAGKKARFHSIYKCMERIAHVKPAAAECGGGLGYLTVNPEGTIFACHREGSSDIGDVWSGIDERRRAPWYDNRLFARTKCPDCWARWVCGGGCRQSCADHIGDIRAPDPVYCWFKKVLIRWTLWLLSELTPEEVMRVTGRGPKAKGQCAACARRAS